MTPLESNSQVSQRAAVLGIQVISKGTGKRLGIVTEVWLDVDQRQIMGFSVADRYIPSTSISLGDPFYMSLERISLLGPDAILVDNENVLEDILVSERFTNLIGNEVVTESGELLGKVRDYQFEPETGNLAALILASIGSNLIPESLISTYELDVNEIIAVGRERIIVTEGMEERLVQLTKGVLEKLGLGKPPWEQEFEDDYLPPRTSSYSNNSLGSGQRGSVYQLKNQCIAKRKLGKKIIGKRKELLLHPAELELMSLITVRLGIAIRTETSPERLHARLPAIVQEKPSEILVQIPDL